MSSRKLYILETIPFRYIFFNFIISFPIRGIKLYVWEPFCVLKKVNDNFLSENYGNMIF